MAGKKEVETKDAKKAEKISRWFEKFTIWGYCRRLF